MECLELCRLLDSRLFQHRASLSSRLLVSGSYRNIEYMDHLLDNDYRRSLLVAVMALVRLNTAAHASQLLSDDPVTVYGLDTL